MRIGFIGLGAMGGPMARNLLAAGFPVTGYDVVENARQALEKAGGHAAASPAECVAGADIIILMVINADQADSLLFDETVIRAMSPGAIVVTSLTQPPARAAAQAANLESHGIVMLDAPVSGGTAGAKAATLTIMASGPEDAWHKARPVFDSLGKNFFWFGADAGKGSVAKAVNQLLAGVHLAAAAEAMMMAENAGLPLETIHRMISVSAGNSWMWEDRGPRMLQSDPQVTSAVEIFVKDLGIVLAGGNDARIALPLAAAARQMFLAASGLGHGLEDDSQVLKAYRALNGGKNG